MGHTGPVDAVRFSPDGSKVATGASDKTARIFSPDDGSLITTVTAEAEIRSVDWSQDGQILVTGDGSLSDPKARGFVSLWRLDGTLLKRFDALGVVSSLRSTKNGAVLYTWSKYPKKGAVILDLSSGQYESDLRQVVECPFLLGPLTRWPARGHRAASMRRTPDLADRRRPAGPPAPRPRFRKWSAGWGADGTTIAWGNAPYRDRPPLFNDMGPRTHSFDLKTLQAGEPTGDFQIGSMDARRPRIEKGDATELLIKWGGEVVTKSTPIPWRNVDVGGLGRQGPPHRREPLRQCLPGRREHGEAETPVHRSPRPNLGRSRPPPTAGGFLTASQDSTLRIWSLDDSSAIMACSILILYFSDDGEWIAGAQKGYYAASPGGEQLMGWHVSNGLNSMSSYYPASQFRKTFYRPDVIKRLLDAASLDAALAESDAAAAKTTQQVEVAEILPPTIAITSPSSAKVQITDAKTLEVEAVAHSVGTNPITALRVLLDGRPISDGLKSFREPVTGEARETWTVEIPPGTHQLIVQASSASARAFRSDRGRAGRSPPLRHGQATGNFYVLAIGINDYSSRQASQARLCLPRRPGAPPGLPDL